MYDNLPVPCLGNALVTCSNDSQTHLVPHLQQAPNSALGINAIFCPQDIAHVLHVHKTGLEPIDHVIEGFRLAISAASQKNTGQTLRRTEALCKASNREWRLLTALHAEKQVCCGMPGISWSTQQAERVCARCLKCCESAIGTI